VAYRFDSFEFDDASFRLSRAGESVPLEPKALRLLLYLLENPNRLVRKQELLDYVWPEANVGENALTRAIGLLRKALDDDIRDPRFIETVPTLGYRFITQVAATGAARPAITQAGVPRIGDARIANETASQPAEPPERLAKGRSSIVWIAAATFALAFGTLAFVHFRQTPAQRQRVQYQISPPEGELDDFKLSPDGKFLAFNTGEQSTSSKIWIRSLDGLDTRLLADIEGFVDVEMFWSRDGESIAYFSGSKLYKIPRRGGPAVLVTEAP
jgi:DNA-binding winged helix-turn-helix (wHTH) protein